jgi:hypothetical protein
MPKKWYIMGWVLTETVTGLERYAHKIVRPLDAHVAGGHALASDSSSWSSKRRPCRRSPCDRLADRAATAGSKPCFPASLSAVSTIRGDPETLVPVGGYRQAVRH